jgi:hypothetical protein
MASSEELMEMIAWNPDGFRLIEVLPKGEKCNTDYSSSSVLPKLWKRGRQFRNET